MNIHHFAILTKDIDKTQTTYEALGYQCETHLIRDELRGVDILFMLSQDNIRIELVSPFKDDSVVAKIPQYLENSIYHTCYLTSDLDAKIVELTKNKFILIDPPKPAIALDNKQVCFLLSKATGIIELLEQ